MRILIYGAGVIGQICAARLHQAGHDVTVLARYRTLDCTKQA
jgi:2-dehydropantoate 2-reductase